MILPVTAIFRPVMLTFPEPPVAFTGPVTEMQLVVLSPSTLKWPLAVTAPMVMSFNSFTVMLEPLALTVPKLFVELPSVILPAAPVPVFVKLAVFVTVAELA